MFGLEWIRVQTGDYCYLVHPYEKLKNKKNDPSNAKKWKRLFKNSLLATFDKKEQKSLQNNNFSFLFHSFSLFNNITYHQKNNSNEKFYGTLIFFNLF